MYQRSQNVKSFLFKTKLSFEKYREISKIATVVQDEFESHESINKAFHDVFKFHTFRSQQLRTIAAVMSKKDVLLIAPTGGGKSLCFQLPAIVNYGLTLVISPLVALMQNQVWALKRIGVNAEYLSYTNEAQVNKFILDKMICNAANPLKLLYVTPERLAKSKNLINALSTCYMDNKLSMIAIDEVHCVSEWGHGFRPDYKKLRFLKTTFPNIPILGVTSTATNKVIADIQQSLNIPECMIIKAPMCRPNIYYHVIEKPTNKKMSYQLLANLLKERYAGNSGIIYAHSKTECENIASALNSMKLKVQPYHADLPSDQRTDILEKWLSGEIQAVVATIAFGMGIDKLDVRFVIHYSMSRSMQNFYQESGRAGRNGATAESILFYSFTDIFRLTTVAQKEPNGLQNAYQMIEYAIAGHNCRRDTIEKHFLDFKSDANECSNMCDHCHYTNMRTVELDITKYSLDLCTLVRNSVKMNTPLTGHQLIDLWYRRTPSKLHINEVPIPTLRQSFAEQIVALLIIKNILKEKFHKTKFKTHSYIVEGDVIPKNLIFHQTPFLDLPKVTLK